MNNGYEELQKTTFVWKEEDGYATVIKNDGGKVVLNKILTVIWKNINDDSEEDIYNQIKKDVGLEWEAFHKIIEDFINVGIISNEDSFWEE